MGPIRICVRRASAAILSTSLWAGPLSFAHAAPASNKDAAARELYQEGDKAYAEGDYELALKKFLQAHDLSKRDLLLYNIGNTYERLGKYQKAADALKQYLPKAKKLERAILEKRISNLEERASKQRADRAERERRKAEAAEQARAKQEQEEKKKQKAAQGSDPKANESNPLPVLPLVLLGVGVAGVGTGTYFGLQALSARSEIEEDCKSGSGRAACSSKAADAIDRDKTSSLIADVGFGVGIVALGVGSYLLLTNKNEKSPRIEANFHPKGGGVSFGGHF